MGVNQHQRGVWVNEQIYSVHLLLGKHGLPGCGAFSLTGQPSACGSAREVGAFCHRLPSDMLVANPKHRAKTEKSGTSLRARLTRKWVLRSWKSCAVLKTARSILFGLRSSTFCNLHPTTRIGSKPCAAPTLLLSYRIFIPTYSHAQLI